MASPFTVVETPAFTALVAGYVKDGHKKLPQDLEWLKGHLAEAPEKMGDHVPGLKKLPLPVFKARCKDSCHTMRSQFAAYSSAAKSSTDTPACRNTLRSVPRAIGRCIGTTTMRPSLPRMM